MKDLAGEILAYSLQNAIEHGKAEASRILPKLFQHGLEKKDIGKVMPTIVEVIKKVNSMSSEEKTKAFSSMKEVVKKGGEKERDLPELKVKGKLVFRMAPFPSGALHIGNAKTFILNALYAEKYNGKLILVMDDTIGSIEKPIDKESYKLLEDAFRFLKIKYDKPIVYKSDRLKIYYKYAEQMIKKDAAYVCHCQQDELRSNRERGIECSCRKYPVDVQLLRWKEMFNAREGHATLRIKTSMKHSNPAFRDRVLFKISDREHPRVKKKYRIWPSLEMSWSIDDHLLGMTHILRGNDLQIESDMEKYIWDIFGWKHPDIIHTGLVNITGVKLSKSKAQKEVRSGEYIGWDDPRTWSIQSLERRGIKPEAIKKFVKEIGLNKNNITIPIDSLYSINRRLIDIEADRFSFIFNPIELKIKNKLKVKNKEIEVKIHPDKNKTRKIKIEKIFISGDDFKKQFGKEIRLINLYNVKIGTSPVITSVENKKIPRINWVSENVPVKILLPSGIWAEGIAEEAVSQIKRGQIIQFERVGFARYDGQKNGIYEFWFAHK